MLAAPPPVVTQGGNSNARARVRREDRVPRTREVVTLEWIGPDGRVDDSYAFTVTRSDDYRVYRSRRYAQLGSYEVRLYNSGRHLIGRRVFEVR